MREGTDRSVQVAVLSGGVLASTLLLATIWVVAPGPVADWQSPDAGENSVGVESVSGNATVTITYTDQTGQQEQFVVEGVHPRLSDSEEGWAIVDRTRLPSALEKIAAEPGAGVVGFGEWALVGSARSATVTVDGTELTVVVPEGRTVDPARKAGFVEEFAGPYALSPEGSDDPVVLVSVPDVLPSRGLMYPEDSGYVTREAFWDGTAHSVWIHEYLHARQDFRTTTEMRWFREASAEYLSYRFMQEQYEGVTEADVRSKLAAFPEYDDVVLSNATTWQNGSGNYHAGARLLASVDAAIRAESGGERTLVDVFRAMNGESEPITVQRFVALIEDAAGTDQSWVETAITERGGASDRNDS